MISADVSCSLLEFDFCVAPESKILKSDLTWVRADRIALNDELVAFDEHANGHEHSFRAANVLGIRHIIRPRVRIETTHGVTVVATEHPFLARRHKYNKQWVKAKDLQPGMQMTFLAEPWDVDASRDAGYLAGFFDGEGWIGRVNVGFAQNRGPTLQRVQRLLAERAFEFRESTGNSTAQCEITNGIRPTLRFLGMIRPPRLMAKARQIWEGRRTWGKQSPICRVLSVELLEDGAVVAIETTTKTYISDGFFSHNSGIEAVLTGRCLWAHGFDSLGARQYIRLARLGMHAGVTSLKVGQPVDFTLPDDQLKPALDAVKKAHPLAYDTSKRTVHANNFGMSIYGMVEKFPEFFPDLKAATEFQQYYYALAPDLPKWHWAERKQARETGKLGGMRTPSEIEAGIPPTIWEHPYGYQHWFWDVLTEKPTNEFQARKWLRDPTRAHRIVYRHGRPFVVRPGGDWNRVVAFYPQSIAAGRLKEAELDLFLPWAPDYIGDVYFGRTPLCGPIHDSLLLHVPNRCVDRVVEIVARVMQRPSERLPIPIEWGWGPYLPIGVAAKIGKNWAPAVDEQQQAKIFAKTGVMVPLNENGMEDLAIPAWVPMVQHAGEDAPVLPRESEGEEEEWQLLKRQVA